MGNFQPNDNFKYFLYWVTERMNIFWRRYLGDPQPYSEDPIFQQFKFTNVYRSLDRVSQYMLKNVIYNGKEYEPEEMFWRILVFKHFNQIETWELLIKEFGDINFNIYFNEISEFLVETQKLKKDFTPYNNAYMLTAAFLSGNTGKYTNLKGNGWKKYQYYFYIFDNEIFQNGFIYDLLKSESLEILYDKVLSITSFADFLSMQFVIDLNYSNLFDFDENSFINSGLGSRRGIDRVCSFSGGVNYEEVIYWVHQNFSGLMKEYGYEFNSLPGRNPSLMDIQNCFCEVDKYLRGIGSVTEGKNVSGKRIKNKFLPNSGEIDYIFPPKWNVEL